MGVRRSGRTGQHSGKTAVVVARGGNEVEQRIKDKGKPTEYTETLVACGFGNPGKSIWDQYKPTPAFDKRDMVNTKRLYHVKSKAPAQPSAMTPADAKALAEAVKVLVTEVVDANKLTAAITVAGNEKYSEYADALQSLLDHAQTWLPRMQQIAAEDAAARSQGLHATPSNKKISKSKKGGEVAARRLPELLCSSAAGVTAGAVEAMHEPGVCSV